MAKAENYLSLPLTLDLPVQVTYENLYDNTKATTNTSDITCAIMSSPSESTLGDEKILIGEAKLLPPTLPSLDDYAVTFDGPDDPTHPYNWKLSIKLLTAIISCSGTFVVTLTSGILAPGIDIASKEFDVGSEVGTLSTSLYVLGFACAPMIWAPGSELYGRKWPLTIAMLAGGIFTIGSAASKDIQTLIICRFFTGMCGASQLAVVPGLLTDLFDTAYRGVAIMAYALTVFIGPLVGPIIGGFITKSDLGWRWTLYISAICSFLNGVLSILFLKETYAPCILIKKAKTLREITGNWGIHAKQEKIEFDFMNLAEKYFTRPLRLLVTELILLLVSLYMTFIYALVYALLEAYPFIFQKVYGMSLGVDSLPFIGVIIGQIMGFGYIASQQKTYAKKLAAKNNIPVPEWRLSPPLLGGPVFTIGIFWLGWTGFTTEIPWEAPAAAGIFIGFGVICVFVPCFVYIVDSYLPIAASAVAANIILRSSVAAGFPMFTTQMFEKLGIQWACTLLGCLAALMIPIPYVFRSYGKVLRERSKLFQ
ncbi:hypothetical protein N7528_002883 [Penicillium herquei]|nr:hypothetical protein N7528_002883 [Penicillium herquei]